jgi:hypothetical protein
VLQGRHVDPNRHRTPQSGSEDRQSSAQGGRRRTQTDPWQLGQVREAIEQLEEDRFADGERKMSEAERPDLYEPDEYVVKEPIERQRLVDQLVAAAAAA